MTKFFTAFLAPAFLFFSSTQIAAQDFYGSTMQEVRIELPLDATRNHHLATFGRGAFFGEMTFLDGDARSADAIAATDTELYVLSRKTFDKLAEEHKKVALKLLEGIASVLAARLRFANAEMRALES